MMYFVRFVMLLVTAALMLFLQGALFQFGFNNFISEPLDLGNLNIAHSMGVVILSALLVKLDKKDGGVDITDDDFYYQFGSKISETLIKLLVFYVFMLIPYFML